MFQYVGNQSFSQMSRKVLDASKVSLMSGSKSTLLKIKQIIDPIAKELRSMAKKEPDLSKQNAINRAATKMEIVLSKNGKVTDSDRSTLKGIARELATIK